MDTKAWVAGRPIHPMLVAFPVALFTATLAAELAHIGTGDAFYFRAAMVANVTGVVMALLAAIPGVIAVCSRRKGSPGRAIGMKQAELNLVTVALFATSGAILYYDWTTKMMVDGRYYLDAHLPLAIDVVGLVAMVVAGTLGWALALPTAAPPASPTLRASHDVPLTRDHSLYD